MSEPDEKPKGVVCPSCSYPKLYTIESRPRKDAVERWRKCPRCDTRVKTREKIIGPARMPRITVFS